MPGKSPEEDYILKISERARTLKDGIEIYVFKVCEVLKSLHEKCKGRKSGSLPEALKNSLTKHFRDIFWSLKLHLLFHGVPWPYAALEDIGAWESVSLSADQMKATPDEKNVIDPGSKILEIVSRHFLMLSNIYTEQIYLREEAVYLHSWTKTPPYLNTASPREKFYETPTSKKCFRLMQYLDTELNTSQRQTVFL